MNARGNGGRWSECLRRACTATLAVASLVVVGDCGPAPTTARPRPSAPRSPPRTCSASRAWTAGRPAPGRRRRRERTPRAPRPTRSRRRSTSRTSSARPSTTRRRICKGSTTAGSSLALDMVIPTQQPNQFFFGSVQLSANAAVAQRVQPVHRPGRADRAAARNRPRPCGSRSPIRSATACAARPSTTCRSPWRSTRRRAPPEPTSSTTCGRSAANNAEFSLTPSPGGRHGRSRRDRPEHDRRGARGRLHRGRGAHRERACLPGSPRRSTRRPPRARAASSPSAPPQARRSVRPPSSSRGRAGGCRGQRPSRSPVAPAAELHAGREPGKSDGGARGHRPEHGGPSRRQNGFAAAVTFSAAGLPAGVAGSDQPGVDDRHDQRRDLHRGGRDATTGRPR